MTLANLDLLVTDLFGAKPRATGSAWTEDQLALGAFIGEMYCRRFGGRWLVVSSTPMTQWHLTWPSGITVNPFQILETRLNLGSETTILSQVAKSLRPLLKNGEAEDPPEVPGELAAQAEDFAKDPKRLAWALQFGKVALLDGLSGAGFRVCVARWARALKQLNDAAEQLHAAAEIEPQNYAIALEQAEVASAQANRTAAEQHARRATTLRPDRPGPWFALAAAQVALEQYGPAIDSYKRAITLAPERAADLAESLRHLEALKTDAEDPLF